METKRVLCSSCDIYCQVQVDVEDGRVARVKALDPRPLRSNICMKGVHAPSGFAHPDRVLHPLRRAGERGEGRWDRVAWDEALDEIAERLREVVDRHGPEALAVATSQWNTQTENGAGRRFMNLLGTPNWISGVALCAGNTAAVNRLVYGWFPYPDYPRTRCVVLFGHNPRKHSWTPVYNAIRAAQKNGAKLIVLDPRRSENAELADLWLPLRAGTDAAMCFGWIKVILDEGLHDRDFVARWTSGFDAFRRRVDEFPLDRVAAITGCDPERIAAAARMYATNTPGVIPGPQSPTSNEARPPRSASTARSASSPARSTCRAARSCTASTPTSSRRASSSCTRRCIRRRRRSSSGRTPTPCSPTAGWNGSGSPPGASGGTSTRTSSPAATWRTRPRRSGRWRPASRTPSRRSSPSGTTP